MNNLLSHLDFVIEAHQEHPKKPGNELRYWDMKTPYFIHPLWCAMTIMTETKLPEKVREKGALVLLFHDVLEDTTKGLPNDLSAEVLEAVEAMTFESIEEEMEKIWSRGDEMILFKLYDKVSNLLDAVWMKPEQRREYEKYTYKLLERVNEKYGELNITGISRSLIKTDRIG